MPDIYFRNPERYIAEAQEADVRLFSWDVGNYRKRNLDPMKFMSIYLGSSRPWKLLTMAIEGASEYDQDHLDINKPVAVYPTWRFEYGYGQLNDYCKYPVGEDARVFDNENINPQFRPVEGQPHKVVIYDPPNLSTVMGEHMFRRLRAMKALYPGTEFIIHNTASYRVMFGVEFDGATFDPAMTAHMGSVILPNGKAIGPGEHARFQMWLKLLGFRSKDLKADRATRVLYNIESVRWADENYKKNLNFRVIVTEDIDPDSPDADYEIEEATRNWVTNSARLRGRIDAGDGVICDACSLVDVCKYYREGAVCSVPSSSSSQLATMFGTRDASVIVDGLLELTQLQAKRVELDLKEEEVKEERLPLTDKRIKDLFDAGVKVAKLIDPTLNGKGTTVNVGVVGGAAIVSQQTPQELMAHAVRTLESHGVKREDITSDMIKGLLEGVASRSAVDDTIEAEFEVLEDGR